MKIKTYLSCLGLFFLIVLFVGVSPVIAQTVPISSYDWSTTLDARQKNVLGVVQAQESTASAQKTTTPSTYLRFNNYLFGSNLTPSSPFYFIKPFQENIQLTFTFDQQAKENLRVQIAGERLGEVQRLATSNNNQAITAAAKAYDQAMTSISNNLASLKKGDSSTDDLLKLLEEETAKHDVILEQVRVQVPDQVMDELDKALRANWKGTDMIADLKDRPAIPSDVVSRLQSLKSQGLLTPEEVTKIVGVKSRVDARQEIGKYVNEGVISESDFIRLNETTKSFYPEEFYKAHETLRFQEMQKLESQKPDDATLNKIQVFAKTYRPGDQVPSGLRKYWVPVIRLEEIQNTLRPDLINPDLFKQNDQEFKKFHEVVERFKPRPEDIILVRNFIQNNKADVNNLPPEYQRMYSLGQRYGAQCGSGSNWVPESQNPAGGYCAPNGSNVSGGPRYEDFTKGKSCNGNIVNAKSSAGACSAYPADCIPPGWSKTDSCIATSPVSGNQGSVTGARISCPSNAHFVPVSYDPNGGYCIPNYTQVGFDQSTGASGSACPSSYHRNYSGGPCVPDNNTNTSINNFSPAPLTVTPGGPYYTNSGRCGTNSHWVPEPINPNGGYCISDGASTGSGNSPSRESQEAACRSGGGTCTGWNNGACSCTYSGSGNTNNTTPYNSPSQESQEAACRSGGGTCTGWNNGACSCERSGSTPPSGYGSCGSGLYWNGSACMSSSSPLSGSSSGGESQEDACRRGTNCSWTGSSCQCTPTQTQTPAQTSAPAPAPEPAPAQTSAPAPESTPAPAPSP